MQVHFGLPCQQGVLLAQKTAAAGGCALKPFVQAMCSAAAIRQQPCRPRCLTASLRALIKSSQLTGWKDTMAVVWNNALCGKHSDAARMAYHGGLLATGLLSDPGVQQSAAPTGWVQAGNSGTLLSNQVVQGRGFGRPCWTSNQSSETPWKQNVPWPCLI